VKNSEPNRNLIFLISQPRSGSTLLQLILAGHPDIATTSEPWIALHPVYALRESGLSAEYSSSLARNALLEFLRQGGMDEGFYKKQLADFLGSFYARAATRKNARYFLDKTPRYYHIIPELGEMFPDAKFILLFRNPLAVLNSFLKTWVGKNWGRINRDYLNDLMVAPQKLLEGVEYLSDKCIRVRYEDLVIDPKGTIRKICDHLGVSYSDDLLNYGNRIPQRWEFGDKVGVHAADRPTESSLHKWKEGFADGRARRLAFFYLQKLGPTVVEKMGYSYKELEMAVNTGKNGKDAVPLDILMRANTSLLDQIEIELYARPLFTWDVIRLCLRSSVRIVRQRFFK
jgi:hypothetical protein